MRTLAFAVLVAAGSLAIVGCPEYGDDSRQKVEIDGSSTVQPLTAAVAEEFLKEHEDIRVTVGISGTGGGFKRFFSDDEADRTDINDASRPIKDKEKEQAEKVGVEYLEIPVAYDGLSVVVHPDNDWCTGLTVEQLHQIWRPENPVNNWNEVDASWPNEKIELYGPGSDSGTFDYFTETVNDKSGACRSDFQQSEDDNVLVQGVAGDKHAMAFFGYSYYAENKDKLKVVPIKNKDGNFVGPTPETIENGSYNPLSRPLFIYVSKKALERDEVKKFVTFYLENASKLCKDTGFTSLPKARYEEGLKKINQ